MESDSSAKNLLSLFSSSDLTTFAPVTSRNFYKTSPPPTASSPDEDDPPDEPPRKRRRRSFGEWTNAELRALETYRNLKKGDDLDNSLRDVLLPNRTPEEVKLKLLRIEKSRQERRGSKLLDLKREEDELFEEEKKRVVDIEKDYDRRRKGMDEILGLGGERNEEKVDEVKHEGRDVKASLDEALGLVKDSVDKQEKRELDEALGLTQ